LSDTDAQHQQSAAAEEGQHKELYAFAGLALFKAQCLEAELSNLYVLHRLQTGEVSTEEQRDAMIDRSDSLTLGKLIRESLPRLPDNAPLAEQLADALRTRNTFIHHYFRDRAEQHATAWGRDAIIAELQTFIGIFENADRALQHHTASEIRRVGLSHGRLLSAAQEMFGSEIAGRLFPQVD